MRNTAAKCQCCGAREEAGSCVKGQPMCACEQDDSITFNALACPECGKCPAHCNCYESLCNCKGRINEIIFEIAGHNYDCPGREKSREVIETNNLQSG